jgi:hypothetical protein
MKPLANFNLEIEKQLVRKEEKIKREQHLKICPMTLQQR